MLRDGYEVYGQVSHARRGKPAGKCGATITLPRTIHDTTTPPHSVADARPPRRPVKGAR
jgi:hypothetical protein